MTWYSTTLHAYDITQHDNVKYCLIMTWHDMTWHFIILSQVPMTGVFGKCTNNCGLCNEPREKVSYCFHNWFILQTFVHGVNFPNVYLVIVITFPWRTYLATWCTKRYCLSTHKSFLCLSSINKPWQNDKKCEMISKRCFLWLSVWKEQVSDICTSAPFPWCGKDLQVTNVSHIYQSWKHSFRCTKNTRGFLTNASVRTCT